MLIYSVFFQFTMIGTKLLLSQFLSSPAVLLSPPLCQELHVLCFSPGLYQPLGDNTETFTSSTSIVQRSISGPILHLPEKVNADIVSRLQ